MRSGGSGQCPAAQAAEGGLDGAQVQRAMDGPIERALHARIQGGLGQPVRQLRHVRVAVGGGQHHQCASLRASQGRPLGDLGVVDEVRERITDVHRHRPARADRLLPAEEREPVPEREVREVHADRPAVHHQRELVVRQAVDQCLQACPGVSLRWM